MFSRFVNRRLTYSKSTLMKRLLLCLLLVSCKTTKQYNFKNIKAATPEDAIKAINNTKVKLHRNDSLYLILLLLLLSPLSMWAQSGDEYDPIEYDCTEYEAVCFTKAASSVVRVFPNPTRDIIQITGLKSDDTEGVIFDILGREIRRFKLKNEQEIDMLALSATTYFLFIPNEGTFKIVKL